MHIKSLRSIFYAALNDILKIEFLTYFALNPPSIQNIHCLIWQLTEFYSLLNCQEFKNYKVPNLSFPREIGKILIYTVFSL